MVQTVKEPVPITLKVVTPLFLGNGGEKEGDIPSELRPPSIKGVLRFWHRAVGPDNLETEAEYFGSIKGQSSFLLQVRKLPNQEAIEDWKNEFSYLGYGLKQKGCCRKYIKSGEKLELCLIFRSDATPEAQEAVLRSFRLLNLFGGLGSRCRRGIGSVNLEDNVPKDVESLILQIRNELSQYTFQNELNYTGFSQSSRIVIPFVKETWESALRSIEAVMQEFRSAFTNPDMFAPDRNLIDSFLNTGSIDEAPHRISFGLPHNYFFKDTYKSASIAPANEKYSHRASPLFVHIHQLLNDKFAVVVSFLPAPLLPQGELLEIVDTSKRTQFHHKTQKIEVRDEYMAVIDFVNHLRNLPEAREVNWRS